jgi:hypothetical protein
MYNGMNARGGDSARDGPAGGGKEPEHMFDQHMGS